MFYAPRDVLPRQPHRASCNSQLLRIHQNCSSCGSLGKLGPRFSCAILSLGTICVVVVFLAPPTQNPSPTAPEMHKIPTPEVLFPQPSENYEAV